MAIYHCKVSVMSRKTGRTASGAAAYRAGERIKDYIGNTHDYRRKSGVLHSEIILPTGAPTWMINREALWRAADDIEKHPRACFARECEIALPAEISTTECIKLARSFARFLTKEYCVATDIAIHAPDRRGDQRNTHAHIMFTTRIVCAEGFGRKTRELDDRKTGSIEIQVIRQAWEDMCNHILIRHGFERITAKSLKDQGIDRTPQIHVGVAATAMRRKDKNAQRADINDKIKAEAKKWYEVQQVEAQKQAQNNEDMYARLASVCGEAYDKTTAQEQVAEVDEERELAQRAKQTQKTVLKTVSKNTKQESDDLLLRGSALKRKCADEKPHKELVLQAKVKATKKSGDEAAEKLRKLAVCKVIKEAEEMRQKQAAEANKECNSLLQEKSTQQDPEAIQKIMSEVMSKYTTETTVKIMSKPEPEPTREAVLDELRDVQKSLWWALEDVETEGNFEAQILEDMERENLEPEEQKELRDELKEVRRIIWRAEQRAKYLRGREGELMQILDGGVGLDKENSPEEATEIDLEDYRGR